MVDMAAQQWPAVVDSDFSNLDMFEIMPASPSTREIVLHFIS